MSKSVENLSTVQEFKTDVLKLKEKMVPLSKESSEERLIERFKSIEKELDQIFIDDEDQKIKADESLNFIKRKLKQLKSLVSQYENQQNMEKRPSFSDQQLLSEAHETRTMFEFWQKLRVEEHILVSPMMSNLLQGYGLLNSDLRLCCLSFAVFPEKAIIKKRSLIYWWMAEGFIKKSGKESAEKVGEIFFRKLISKGIIKPWSKNEKTPTVNSCTVHPWIRRMLISAARKVEVFDFDEEGRITCKSNASRCLCFPMDDKVSSSDDFWKRDYSTMFNVNESYLSFDEDFLSKFKKVKILQLGSWQSSPYHHIEVENDKFLNCLGVLKHLRYLSLRGISRITTLPSSITECRNLEILDLKGCHTLESLPSDFGSLRKLTHLDFSECYLLENMPNNQHKLLLLKVLKGFDAEKYSVRSYRIGTSLSAFGQLENLRKLSVLLTSNTSQELAEDLGDLCTIKHLRILTVTWRMDSTKHVKQPMQEEEEDEKEAYHNLEYLEKLDLRCFPFQKRPIWLSAKILKNLKRLYISGGPLEELIPKNTKDACWNVEILRLKHLKNLKLGLDQVKENFPHLSYSELPSE